ncbi:TetR-like C-terminal domain-containing protein [Mycobacterium sp. GA-2829]|uniref:TetR-like C-terminal domain-containing protein n=1 Tax=Mycobacterium sp. GA-2829 TaxID=1772283 RepID=UPI0007400066|nr:TetR-like C-terminal domain-containing protein [Mycobacterium sp. GA-2829]KUI29265.1 hypothetical protein AU194_20540 [Mycobacterium sp. GA-2829]
MEDRIRQAACRLYGRVGWAGFNIQAVATEARVGKSSIYLRWPDRTALLLDTLQFHLDFPYHTDTGSLRGDLLVLSRTIFDLLASDVGDALVRLSAEARSVSELAPRWWDFTAAQVAVIRAIAQRGIDRGDLPTDAAVPLMLDALFGGLLMHQIAAPSTHLDRTGYGSDSYPVALVDMVLASVTRR